MAFTIPRSILDAMRSHAEADYPEECCGVLLADADGNLSARRCRNVQNELHAQDPVKHPRDARTAYAIDPRELLDLTRELDRTRGTLRAIYHSHPDVGAYFSQEDRARAVMEEWDEPLYPGASFVVLSVRNGKIDDLKSFAWDENSRDYLEELIEANP